MSDLKCVVRNCPNLPTHKVEMFGQEVWVCDGLWLVPSNE